MNRHTQTAREWLDRRYSRNKTGGYLAHQPICGLRTERAEPNAILRYARTYRLLEWLQSLEFDSALDVGGGEGYLAALVRDIFGTKVVHSSDLSVEACHRSREIFGISGAAADSNRLPFADKSYDLVMCSEVIEHLSRPALAISELARVARKYVVISTAEFCPAGEVERALRGYTLDRSYPHSEVNWFTSDDFRSLLGDGVTMGPQFRSLGYLLPSVVTDQAQVENAITFLTDSDVLDVDHTGVIVISPRHGAPAPGLTRQLTGQQKRRILNRLLDPPADIERSGSLDESPDEDVLSRLQCPLCHSVVTPNAEGNGLICRGGSHEYALERGTPVMFVDPGDEPSAQAMEAEGVATLAAGDRNREQVVRDVIGRLHNNESRNNAEWVQQIAQQLLRVLWFYRRDESLGGKIGRVLGRVAGKPPAGYNELQAALAAATGGTTANASPRQTVSRT